MGTTNILDLNNRLSKVEKENVAQNSYTSLKNKPKINSVTLTGNKSLADIGAAAAADLGDLTDLTTTDKSSCVGAINEVNGFAKSLIAPSTLLTSSDDLNSVLTAGVYFTEGTSVPAHAIGNNHIIWVIKQAATNYTRYLQVMYSFNSKEMYFRQTTDAGSTWSNWTHLEFIDV